MNKFNQKVDEILKEAIGDILSGAIGGASAAYQAALDPSKGIQTIAAGIGERMKETQEKKTKPLSLQNPPNLGQIIVTKAPVYGVSKKEKNPDFEPDILKRKPNASPREIENANREFLPSKTGTINPEAIIIGKVTQKVDNEGVFGVALTDEKGKPSQKYIFAQTESNPYWQVYDITKTPDDDILVDDKGLPMKLKAIKTGVSKSDVSVPLRNWMDYNTFLQQQKK